MKTFNLKLTEVEINKALTALGNMPYVETFQLINNIQMQCQKQDNQETSSAKKPTKTRGKK